ncbi:class II glutamine amidotransferase [Agromyces binzhouensis]|nr:hypothetical protein [Agromyces binzhouensis]
MCRWLAYSGEPLRASAVLLDATHSLVAQSLDSPLGAETVNGDGFGIDPSLYPHLMGTTDSEVLFHLAITNGLADDPVSALRATVDLVERIGRDHGVMFPMQGTVAVADGATIWALRYSTQGRSRTLFHSADIPTIRRMYPDAERLGEFGEHAHVVVSEPLNDLPGLFTEVPESTIAILDREGYHHEPFRSAA